MVGAALKYVQDESLPWHRVLGSGGVISDRGDGGAAAERQAVMLQQEGVAVSESTSFSRGKWRVTLADCGWCAYLLTSPYRPLTLQMRARGCDRPCGRSTCRRRPSSSRTHCRTYAPRQTKSPLGSTVCAP